MDSFTSFRPDSSNESKMKESREKAWGGEGSDIKAKAEKNNKVDKILHLMCKMLWPHICTLFGWQVGLDESLPLPVLVMEHKALGSQSIKRTASPLLLARNGVYFTFHHSQKSSGIVQLLTIHSDIEIANITFG